MAGVVFIVSKLPKESLTVPVYEKLAGPLPDFPFVRM